MSFELHLGDCLEIMPRLVERFDVLICDPPYGTGERIRHQGKFKNTRQSWDKWNQSWLQFVSSRYAYFAPPKKVSIEKGHRLFAWVSKNPVAKKGISPRYGIQAIIAKGPFPVTYMLDWYEYRSNIQTPLHPHQKPVSVMKWLITIMSNPGETICDPFMGSGTTGVACIQTGRKFIGIEKDTGYFKIAEQRIRSAQPALFVEDEKPANNRLHNDRATPEGKQAELFNINSGKSSPENKTPGM